MRERMATRGIEYARKEKKKSGAKYRLKDCQYPCPFTCPDVSRPTGTSLWNGKKEDEAEEEDQKRLSDSRSESLFAKYVRERRTRQKPP